MKTNGDMLRTLSNKDLAKLFHCFCDILYSCGKGEITCLPDSCILYTICNRETDWMNGSYDEELFEKVLDKSFLEW